MFFLCKKNTPTDKQILEVIYNKYYDNFSLFSKDNSLRETKIYVPIDLEKIANELKVDNDIIFGRLYYHLNKKYGYINENGSKVHFFTPKCGKDSIVYIFLI